MLPNFFLGCAKFSSANVKFFLGSQNSARRPKILASWRNVARKHLKCCLDSLGGLPNGFNVLGDSFLFCGRRAPRAGRIEKCFRTLNPLGSPPKLSRQHFRSFLATFRHSPKILGSPRTILLASEEFCARRRKFCAAEEKIWLHFPKIAAAWWCKVVAT